MRDSTSMSASGTLASVHCRTASGRSGLRYEVSVGSAIPAVGLLIVMAGLVLTQIDDRLVAGSR
jgi:hypothetical protein